MGSTSDSSSSLVEGTAGSVRGSAAAPPTVALYLRVSTEDQDLAGQERELRAYASHRGWAVAAVFAEKTTAAGRVERQEWAALIAQATSVPAPFGHVLVWALDRWSRESSFVRAVGSIEALEDLGIQWHSFKEPQLDSSADGSANLARDILRGILPAIASFEARRRSDRTQLAMDEIRSGARPTRSGRPPGRPRKLTPELVARIEDLRAHGGPGGAPLPWAKVAVVVKIPAGTCRSARRSLRRQTPRAANGPDGFAATAVGSQHPPAPGVAGKGAP